MNPPKINPNVRRLACSKTGAEVPTGDFRRPLGLCPCCPAPGMPLLVRYQLDAVGLGFDRVDSAARWGVSADAIPHHRRGLWKYEPLLPVLEPWPSYGCDVGLTPTTRYPQLGDDLGVELWIKSEGANPSGSFKDRGLAVAVALGTACGAKRFCLPTQGNAGVAAALFSSRMRLRPCVVYMPQDYAGSVYHRAACYFGAEVEFRGANIAACGRHMRNELADELAAGELTDVSTFFEPGRLEGKKTMGLEIFEQFGTENLPEYIFYPTGGGTGLVGIWKAFEELIQLGLIASGQRLPRMVAVQSERCAPVVRSFRAGHEEVAAVESLGTVADGLDVPAAIMGHQILKVLRDSGTAVDVAEEDIKHAFARLGREGVSCGYEGAATLAALSKLRSDGTIPADSRVLLLNTSGHAVATARSAVVLPSPGR
ncbi:MAG: threonine synthase [Planctomycetota bacterium]|jgi:threonine synthase